MRSFASRLDRIEARKLAREPKPYYRIGAELRGMIEDPNNPGHLIPDFPFDDWEARCRDQQRRLLAQCEAYAEQLNEGEQDGIAHKPEPSGELAPLKPGQKRARYLFSVENGVEMQLDRLTGEKIEIGRI